ncbi:MAG: hypothetical protein WCC03_14085 [Candidatus Acidiferrales bacterium]
MYPEEKLKDLDETTLRCFNYSRSDWKVTSEGDVVTIASNLGDKSDELALPPLLKHEERMPGRTVRAGLRSALHFNNDWLLAYDGGEWGGGLWLTNEDGTTAKQILADNVRAIIPVDGGLLVLSGLAHMTMDFGNAFIFSNPEGMNISLQHAIHLDGAPSVYAKEPDGSVVFVTTYGLCRISKSGELQRLAYFPKWTRQQYPNSMAVTSDGSIFIGMRMFVLKLRTDGAHYKEEWLLPQECRRFELDKLNCVCQP